MKRLGIWIGILLVLVSMMGTAYPAESSKAPDGYKPISGVTQIGPSIEGVKKILVIEDILPWGMDSNHVVLLALRLPHDTVNATGLPNVVWSDYSLVIVASGQPQYLYDALAPYISPGGALYNWVKAGGVLNFRGADLGWATGSDWRQSFKLPGGITADFEGQNDVSLAGPAKPLPPANGTYKKITDADLDNWMFPFSTYGYFIYLGGDPTLPSRPMVTITIAGTNKQVYIIYKFGLGVVLATMQPLEWGYYCYDWYGYGTANSKYALYNDIDAGRKIDNLIS